MFNYFKRKKQEKLDNSERLFNNMLLTQEAVYKTKDIHNHIHGAVIDEADNTLYFMVVDKTGLASNPIQYGIKNDWDKESINMLNDHIGKLIQAEYDEGFGALLK